MDAAPPAPARAAAVGAGSRTLAQLLERDERARHLLGSAGPLPSGPAYAEALSAALDDGGMPELRREKRRRLLEIAARDLAGEIDLEEAGRCLADLADACLGTSLAHLRAEGGLGIVAMGKLGGRELNYCSDIDLMFVSDGDPRSAAAAEVLLKEIGGFWPEGQAYRIDLNLRPEGRSGPLVRPLDAYLEYYRRWAKEWEHQALLKARHSAGDEDLAGALVERTREIVFPRGIPPERVASIRKMKERVEEHAARSSRKLKVTEQNDVKLGPGGIRDIEFSVQLLQLVHGSSDPGVRSPNTLEALSALVGGGYVAEDDGAGLAVSYRWLRTVEHRLQLWQERQVHHLPADEAALRRIALVMGFKDTPGASAAMRFEAAHRGVLADVRGRFEKLFYRPMIESLADTPGAKLSDEALQERLRILGFRDVARAARTLDGLVSGTSRRAKAFRVLTPALLRWLAATPAPDDGLLSFLRLGDALEGRLAVLGAFRDNPPGLALLAKVLGSGRLLGEVLSHVPDELTTIAGAGRTELRKGRGQLLHEAAASLGWRGSDRRLEGLRRFKRREMMRIAVDDVAGGSSAAQVGRSLADLADACLEAALQEHGSDLAVIGMGKLGGRELSYSSDIDVMFVHDGDPGGAEKAAEDLMRAIGEVTPEGQAFRIDAGLRPEGKSGALARSIRSFREYYERWASPWEFQALTKARPAAGSAEIGRHFLEEAVSFTYRSELPPAWLAEIRHLKARMEKERLPRGIDPRRHLKLGPGGLSDIEFAVQIAQLRHGAALPPLRVTSTLDALGAAGEAGILTPDDARQLEEALRFLMALRNHMFFLYARPTDALPTKPEDLEAIGISLGLSPQPRQELEETYLRNTRRTRRICERLIYGD